MKSNTEHTLSSLEHAMITRIRLMKLPSPVHEYRFAAPRRWSFDMAWVDKKIALECEGGIWTNGRHTRATGYTSDCEKYSVAAILGWIVIRVTTDMIQSGLALTLLTQAFAARNGNGI